jgi:septum formation protein
VVAIELRIDQGGLERDAGVGHGTRIAQLPTAYTTVRIPAVGDTCPGTPPTLVPVAERLLVLASASPARLRLLRDAGFDPKVLVSGVREDEVEGPDTEDLVSILAALKARAVADHRGDAIVIGCDSMLEFQGEPHGKPSSPAQAREWLQAMRGRSGTLFTGHCVIDERTGREASGVAATVVRFGMASDAEIDTYLATGEAMSVAGAFTLDGRSAPFIDGVDGDPSNVIGLSLPTLRALLASLDVPITDLWTTEPS